MELINFFKLLSKNSTQLIDKPSNKLIVTVATYSMKTVKNLILQGLPNFYTTASSLKHSVIILLKGLHV